MGGDLACDAFSSSRPVQHPLTILRRENKAEIAIYSSHPKEAKSLWAQVKLLSADPYPLMLPENNVWAPVPAQLTVCNHRKLHAMVEEVLIPLRTPRDYSITPLSRLEPRDSLWHESPLPPWPPHPPGLDPRPEHRVALGSYR